MMAQPDGYVCDLVEWLPGCPGGERFAGSGRALPVEAIWERFLLTAGLAAPAQTRGTIHVQCNGTFPPTGWTISVKRDGPDRLDFPLALNRVGTTMPSWS